MHGSFSPAVSPAAPEACPTQHCLYDRVFRTARCLEHAGCGYSRLLWRLGREPSTWETARKSETP
jgi:hypothetical protein